MQENLIKAFVLERHCKQRPLKQSDLPLPPLREHEVMVEAHAAGLNLLNAKILLVSSNS